MKYFIGYYVRGAAGEYYDRIASDLSERFGILNLAEYIPAHMTIKQPFLLEDDNYAALETELTRVATELCSLSAAPMTITQFDRYEVNGKTIFLSIAQDAELMERIQLVLNAVEHVGQTKQDSAKPLFPHVSIARHLSPQKSEEVWDYVQTLPEPHFETTFDNITLFVRVENVWKVQKVFEVGK